MHADISTTSTVTERMVICPVVNCCVFAIFLLQKSCFLNRRHKYFRKSYKNAATRANNKYDDLVDEDALTQQALDDGIESSDYVKFVTNNMTTDDNKGFQRVSFYIMALDSYKYTTSNDETQEDADTERLKRMIKKAKEISPNGLLDDAITALSALGINIDLGSDKLWVVSTDTT